MTTATKNTTATATATDSTPKPINASAKTILAVLGDIEARRVERKLQRQLNAELTGKRMAGWLALLQSATFLDVVDGVGGVVQYDYYICEETLTDAFVNWYDGDNIGGDDSILRAAKKTISVLYDRVHNRHGDDMTAKAHDWSHKVGIGLRVKTRTKQRERDAIDRLLGY